MAEGDNQARFGTTAADVTLAAGAAKADPITKGRLPEDAARCAYYAAAGQKDSLPEHQARRNAYAFINAL